MEETLLTARQHHFPLFLDETQSIGYGIGGNGHSCLAFRSQRQDRQHQLLVTRDCHGRWITRRSEGAMARRQWWRYLRPLLITFIRNSHFPCQLLSGPSCVAEAGAKRMPTVVLNVQRQRICAKQLVLQVPWLGMLGPTHQGILIQPRIEPLLALVRECHPLSAADPTQRIVAYWCQQDPKR